MIPTVPLGRSGLKVSVLCLGCMNFGESTSEEDSLAILRAAHEAGVTFWDTANVYGAGRNEEILGRAFQEFGFRDDIVLATKANGAMGPGPNDRGLSRRHLRKAVEESLRRLRTDYIDLYQMHRFDPSTPVDETVETLDTLVREGKIRYYGTSTFASWQMAEMTWRARCAHRVEPVCEQAPYSVLDRRIENDRGGFLAREGWGLIAWSPLAGGQLTGKYGQVSPESPPAGSRVDRNRMWRERINWTRRSRQSPGSASSRSSPRPSSARAPSISSPASCRPPPWTCRQPSTRSSTSSSRPARPSQTS